MSASTSGDLPEGGGGPAPDLHPGTYLIALAAWVWLFGAFWLVFGGEREGAFMVTVSTFFLATFVGVPFIMKRVADRFLSRKGREDSFASFLHGETDTLTGRLGGFAAIVQVVIVPVALALGMTAIGFIIVSARSQFPVQM